MKKLTILALAAFMAVPAWAGNVITRDLARAVVIRCDVSGYESQQVKTEDVDTPVVVGDMPVGVACVLVDTRIESDWFAGTLTVESDDNGTMEQFWVAVRLVIDGVDYTYADWAQSLYQEANGSRYRVESFVKTVDGKQLQYDLTLLRRTPDECEESTGKVVECRDRTTMVIFPIDLGVYAFLDFRPEVVVAPQ